MWYFRMSLDTTTPAFSALRMACTERHTLPVSGQGHVKWQALRVLLIHMQCSHAAQAVGSAQPWAAWQEALTASEGAKNVPAKPGPSSAWMSVYCKRGPARRTSQRWLNCRLGIVLACERDWLARKRQRTEPQEHCTLARIKWP